MANRGPTAATVVTFTDKDGLAVTRTIDPDNFVSVTDIANSLESGFDGTAGQTTPPGRSSTNAPVTPTNSSPSASTLLTSAIPAPPSPTAASEGSASGIASGSEGQSPSRNDSCNSISCKPGLQAAIAVPVVVGALVIFALAFLCIRRRRRRNNNTAGVATSLSEKRQKKPKKWSRHLRIFSFDAELLMGGRFSSSNSLNSRETGSQRSGARSAHNASPSIHSVDEEVAPPYRDAVSHVQPPSTVPMAAGLASSRSDPFLRPDSVATAPPPYPAAAGTSPAAGGVAAAAASNLSRATSRASTTAHTPVSTRSLNDPFRNDAMSPVSPVDGGVDASPFIDPPDTAHSPISPSTSMMFRRRNGLEYEDAQSTNSSVTEVPVVREAQVGRTLSSKQARRV